MSASTVTVGNAQVLEMSTSLSQLAWMVVGLQSKNCYQRMDNVSHFIGSQVDLVVPGNASMGGLQRHNGRPLGVCVCVCERESVS